jgi:hypothetical protein
VSYLSFHYILSHILYELTGLQTQVQVALLGQAARVQAKLLRLECQKAAKISTFLTNYSSF